MNIGTRVLIIGKYYPDPELSPGATGTVVAESGDCLDVIMDSGFQKNGDNRWPFLVTELEVIE